MESLIGSTIGGYKLTRALGSGTTGQTFAVTDGADAAAALKILHPTLSLFTKVETYWGELQQIGALSHPHIIAPSSADWSKAGRFYLTMDLAPGLDLHAALTTHLKLAPSQVLLFAGQVLLALEEAHAAGHVHGAVKPHNIFLVPKAGAEASFSTRLMDFASGALVSATATPAGGPGSAGVAEPAYLAPEQFRGAAVAASDLYALGVVLYEALSGRRPFVGAWEQLAQHHANMRPAPLSGVPAMLGEVVLRALAKTPAARFADATAMREALEAWASSGPPELEAAGPILFAKEGRASGVAQGAAESDQTVKVAFGELPSAVEGDGATAHEEVVLERPPSTVHRPAEKQPTQQPMEQPMADVKSSANGVPEDQELAAIAEKAVTPLKAEKRPTSENKVVEKEPPKPAPVEGYFDEDGELVELPLEKSVRAFVSHLGPVAAPTKPPRGGNGESLEAALDQFVSDAKSWSASLPPPVMDDRQLAALARVPVEAPPPKPAPAPAPVAALPVVARPVAVAPIPPPPARSVLLPSLISFALGGVLFFGAYKLFFTKPTADPGASDAASGAATPGKPDGQATPKVAPLAPDIGATPNAEKQVDSGAAKTADAAAAATATSDGAPAAASSPDAAPTAPVAKKKKAAKKVGAAVAKKKVEPKAKKEKKEKKEKKGGKKGSDWVDPFSQ